MSTVIAEGSYQVFTLGSSEWFWLWFSAATAVLALGVEEVEEHAIMINPIAAVLRTHEIARFHPPMASPPPRTPRYHRRRRFASVDVASDSRRSGCFFIPAVELTGSQASDDLRCGFPV